MLCREAWWVGAVVGRRRRGEVRGKKVMHSKAWGGGGSEERKKGRKKKEKRKKGKGKYCLVLFLMKPVRTANDL